MTAPLVIQYFSDVLCVWAYVGQARLDELRSQYRGRVLVQHRFLNIYGDVRRRIESHGQGADKQADYAERMRGVARRFDHVAFSPRAFADVVPASSNQAHFLLCCLRVAIEEGRFEDPTGDVLDGLLRDIRFAFFQDGRDVAQLSVLWELFGARKVSREVLDPYVQDGAGMALLSHDFQQKDALRIEGSPTYVMDGGRQKLFGNVGYRVIEANVVELLEAQSGGASWC